MTYHCSIAIGHYARALQAGAIGSRGKYHAIAVLQAMWLLADPLADNPIVLVELDDFAGIVPNADRLRQLVGDLVRAGAVERLGSLNREYKLFKPPVEVLDDLARTKLATMQAASTQAQRLRGADKSSLTSNERDAALAKLRKSPSDVRDVLADMAGVARGKLRFSGDGSGAVQAAKAWLATTGATWAQFVQVCEYVRALPVADKPSDIVWLFGDEHADYLGRVLASLRGETAVTATSDDGRYDRLREQLGI